MCLNINSGTTAAYYRGGVVSINEPMFPDILNDSRSLLPFRIENTWTAVYVGTIRFGYLYFLFNIYLIILHYWNDYRMLRLCLLNTILYKTELWWFYVIWLDLKHKYRLILPTKLNFILNNLIHKLFNIWTLFHFLHNSVS